MKNLFKLSILVLPIFLTAINSQGVPGGAIVKGGKTVSKVASNFFNNPIFSTIKITGPLAANREVQVFNKLRARAAKLFDSELSQVRKDDLWYALNQASKDFHENLLKYSGETNAANLIRNQTLILNRFSAKLRKEKSALAASSSSSTRKAQRPTIGTK